MKSIFETVLAGILIIFLCGNAQARNLHVVVFGDSLTSGYELQPYQAFPAKLDRKLKELGYQNVDVINMSVAGDTSAAGLDRFNSVMLRQPDVVIIEFGANDMLRGIDPRYIYQNIGGMIAAFKEKGVYVILMGMKAPPNLGERYAAQVDAIYDKLGNSRIGYYPFALQGIVGNTELNLADGYHPNDRGVDVMVEGMYRLVDAGVRAKWQVQTQDDTPNPLDAASQELMQAAPHPVAAPPKP